MTEQDVIEKLAEHINTMGSSLQVLLEYVKNQDTVIRLIGKFLATKYGTEFTDYIADEKNKKDVVENGVIGHA